jgi:hypothetical protein
MSTELIEQNVHRLPGAMTGAATTAMVAVGDQLGLYRALADGGDGQGTAPKPCLAPACAGPDNRCASARTANTVATRSYSAAAAPPETRTPNARIKDPRPASPGPACPGRRLRPPGPG